MTNNYYQKHKEKIQKEACKRCQYFFIRRKRKKTKKCPRKIEKSVSIIATVIRIFLRNKTRS